MLWLYVSIAAVLLYLCSNIFYKIWLHNKVIVPDVLSLTMAVFVITVGWQAIYAYALNGMGKLRVQLIIVVISAILNVPLSVILIRWVGVPGTVIANIILVFLMNIIVTYQVNQIINQKAKGIWNR